MPFDLARLEGEKRRWVRIGLDDMEVEIRHVGPAEQERYRQKLVSDGVLKPNDKGGGINRGREAAFFEAYAEKYVTDWRNLSIGGTENPPFDVNQMGAILATSETAFKAVAAAVDEEAAFFSVSGSASGT